MFFALWLIAAEYDGEMKACIGLVKQSGTESLASPSGSTLKLPHRDAGAEPDPLLPTAFPELGSPVWVEGRRGCQEYCAEAFSLP